MSTEIVKSDDEPSKPVYALTFNEDGLFLNGRYLRQVQYDSMNCRFLLYMINHPNEVLDYKEVVAAAGMPTKTSKKLPQILNELGFKAWLRTILWPVTTGGKVMLRNPVTVEALRQLGFSPDVPVEKLIKDANL